MVYRPMWNSKIHLQCFPDVYKHTMRLLSLQSITCHFWWLASIDLCNQWSMDHDIGQCFLCWSCLRLKSTNQNYLSEIYLSEFNIAELGDRWKRIRYEINLRNLIIGLYVYRSTYLILIPKKQSLISFLFLFLFLSPS